MELVGLLNKAAEKIGAEREKYDDSQVPTESSQICIVPFFGDFRSTFILSTFLLNRFRSEEKKSKYMIVVGKSGFSGLFPYVDEFWGISKDFYSTMFNFDNKTEKIYEIYRNLNQFFFEDIVIPSEEFGEIYNQGFTDKFFKRYKNIQRTLPDVPSASVLDRYFNRDLAMKGGYKIFVSPSIHMQSFHQERIYNFKVNRDFWANLINCLIKADFVPILHNSSFSYDFASDFGNSVVQFKEEDCSKILSAMRASGLVLDVFSGISRFAISARTPFLYIDERSRYEKYKEYEIDDLCASKIQRKYLFSFSNIIENGSAIDWKENIIDLIVNKLNNFLPTIDRDNLPSTIGKTEVVSYENVRKKKVRRIGTKLLKVPKVI